MLLPDGPFTETDPTLFDFSLTEGRRGGRHHVDAHMRTLIVVEVHRTRNGGDDVIDIGKARV